MAAIFELSLNFKELKDFVDRFVDILCNLARRSYRGVFRTQSESAIGLFPKIANGF